MPFKIVRNNITDMKVDAIVNTANPYPVVGDGTDRAVHEAAGEKLLEARRKIGAIATGQAAVTPAYNLKAKYVIHTVGPVWIDGSHNEEQLLEDCYRNSLRLALKNGCKSVAFPLISTGTYNFPKGRALHIATKVISHFVLNFDVTVYLVVFDRTSYSLSEKLFTEVRSYIDNNFVGSLMENEYRYESVYSQPLQEEIRLHKKAQRFSSAAISEMCADMDCASSALPFSDTDWDNMAQHLEKTFSESLLKLIEDKHMTHAQAYNKANIDKKHFHKIKSNKNYKPTKFTILAFAIALELSLEETKKLMETAGLALSKSDLFDVIVSFFIENKRYDVFELNDVLFEYDLPLLGC